jgi:hypothetical protein
MNKRKKRRVECDENGMEMKRQIERGYEGECAADLEPVRVNF